MERNERGFKTLAVAALFAAIVGLGFAYAAYTQSLDITGTAKLAETDTMWNIKWKNLSNGTANGYADISNSTLAISGDTSISGEFGIINAPGDTITYEWDAVNEGKLDATLTAIDLGGLTCTSATQSEADAVCNYLTIDLSYGGVNLDADDPINTTGLDKTLVKETGTKHLVATITYKKNSDVVVNDEVTVTLGETTFSYSQAS